MEWRPSSISLFRKWMTASSIYHQFQSRGSGYPHLPLAFGDVWPPPPLTVLYCMVLYHTVVCVMILLYTIFQYTIVDYIILYYSIPYNNIQHYFLLDCAILYCTLLYCTICCSEMGWPTHLHLSPIFKVEGVATPTTICFVESGWPRLPLITCLKVERVAIPMYVSFWGMDGHLFHLPYSID